MDKTKRLFITYLGLMGLLLVTSLSSWASLVPSQLSVRPTVTINQASGQADPTNRSPIRFTVVFSKSVTGFTAGDVILSGTAPGTLIKTVSGSGRTYTVSVTGMTGSGTVIAKIPSGAARDSVGNSTPTASSKDNTVTYDITAPTVTINQAAAQPDPTNTLPIRFTVVFSEVVTGFTAGDVTLSGTAPGTLIKTVTGSGPTYTVTVTGLTGSGTVVANIPAGAANDLAGNASTASTSTDNTVTYDVTSPTVTINQAASQTDPTNTSPIRFTVVFSKAVTGFTADDVTLSGTAPGALSSTVTGSSTTYTVAVTGMTGSGTVVASLAAGVAQDAGGNPSAASTSTDNTVTYDVTTSFLGVAASFGAFGGPAGVTNQGVDTVVNGDIGTTAASTLITGFHDSTGDSYTETPDNIGNVTGRIYTDAPPPVIFGPGGPYGGNAQTKAIADAALADANNAYNDLAARPETNSDPSAAGELSGLTLPPGVYKSAGGSFNIAPGGTLTLDALGDPNAEWVFQMGTSLNVGAIGAGATPARVVLINGAQPGNVYWQVGSSATINTGAEMVGTIIASAGITFSTAGQTILTTLEGRALSLNASVTMVNTVINVP